MRPVELNPSYTLVFYSIPIANRLKQVNIRHVTCYWREQHEKPCKAIEKLWLLLAKAIAAEFQADHVSPGLRSAGPRLTAA